MISKNYNIGITINFDTDLYSNGLQQNVVILNNLLNDLDGFKSFYIYQGKIFESDLIEEQLCFPYVNILKNDAIVFDLIIMMGFSVSDELMVKIKNKNPKTKIVLLQCGNQFVENMSYAIYKIDPNHSPLGNPSEIDQIWNLPHYKKNLPFMKAYFKTDKAICVPYIWDSIFIDFQIQNSNFKDKEINFSSINCKSLLVMEPNLFFAKNCILPLYIIERFEQKYPKVLNSSHLLCAKKIAENDYFIKLIMQLDIFKRQNFLKIENRTLFIDAINRFGSILVSHQQDNALNYIYLEAFYLNIPLLHNSDIISDFGYFYPENDIDIAVTRLNEIINQHSDSEEDYKKNCNYILNKYSSKNDKNKNEYKKILMQVLES